MAPSGGFRPQPDNVGILAGEVYFPSTYVRQDELEKHDGVPSGKYTVGLGQQGLAFVGDREDAVSMALTALRRLLEKHGVSPLEVGRLEVGTESSIDASKSIKTYLMALFEDAGNTDVEGVDCVQACYGGTAAVQNAANWVESRSWDGRFAVVVMTDISLYPAGPARPTSGAGAVALLIGPDAPLALERGLSVTHMAHAYDFYKPSGLYPAVDGPLSVYCYLSTLDTLYARYSAKWEKRNGRAFRLDDADHALFHAPYNKLVQKAFARLMYHDICKYGDVPATLAGTAGGDLKDGSHPRPPMQMPTELERALVTYSFPTYDKKVRPSTCVARQCGNMYTASIWSGIPQLIETTGAALEGRRILLYSYGSGMSATMFSLVGRATETPRFALGRLQATSDLAMRLARRVPKSPEDFEQAMQLAEQRYCAGNYKPEMPSLEELEPGTFYLVEVDARYRRAYARKPPSH
ncbi:hydroxymethylglutaryl-synthase [Micractinium conductrix]|uniref:Hydroxymethylglutaryl-CoA synthase n=1 Tax=Micractinium conductrix TaxID=554055 RepID=A0A2P6VQC7_9CHLO|nr:hydroxymethylglutaryl-synthase [Micractinium conductrix]|eukprot:PSC76306.1 hydroxymethylglutaryl-synthase [Micractinium conductrix]